MTATLFLRKVESHPHAANNYRVLYDDIEIGSIGIQNGVESTRFWAWGIDTVLPRQDFPTRGKGADLADCQRQFKAAWHKMSRSPERLEAFLTIKRSLARPWQK